MRGCVRVYVFPPGVSTSLRVGQIKKRIDLPLRVLASFSLAEIHIQVLWLKAWRFDLS